MKKETILQEPIFLTELLKQLLRAGFITKYERLINDEWKITYENVSDQYKPSMSEVLKGNMKLSEFRKKYGIGDPNF